MSSNTLLIPKFPKILSSDESDVSDNEISNKDFVGKYHISNNLSNSEDNQIQDDTLKEVKQSQKLNIIDKVKSFSSKFSLWSEFLMEEELSESINNSLKIKRKRKKKISGVENQTCEAKLAVKKSCSYKRENKQKSIKCKATALAEKLKESRVDIIKRILDVMGEDKTKKLVAEVMDIESVGGMMINNGNRRRSPGGVLFYLVKNDSTISDEQKRDIFCDKFVKAKNKEFKKFRKVKARSNISKHKQSGSVKTKTKNRKKKKSKKNKK